MRSMRNNLSNGGENEALALLGGPDIFGGVDSGVGGARYERYPVGDSDSMPMIDAYVISNVNIEWQVRY